MEVEEPTETTESTEEASKKLMLPVPRVERMLRRTFPDKRVSSGCPVYVTAGAEAVILALIKKADSLRSRGKTKGVDRRTLVAAMRSDPELGRLFRSYLVTPEKPVRVKRVNLLIKSDNLFDAS